MSGSLPSTVRDGRHRHHVRIYFEDTDAGGIVYHARYLGLAERARTEALRDLGIPHAELVAGHGLIFVVRRVKLDYLRPARLDDLLEVSTEALGLTAVTVALRQTFRRAGEERAVAVAELLLACVRVEGQKPARLPPRWREGLMRLVAAGGAGPGASERGVE